MRSFFFDTMAKKRKAAPKRKAKKSTSSTKLWVIIGLLVSVAIIGLVYNAFSSKKHQPFNRNEFVQAIPKGFNSFGIDISHHQGDIDWDELLDQQKFDTLIHFVYIKATEGNSHIDTRWEYNRKTLNNRGIPNGAYHFFITDEPALPQAEHFLAYWKKREVDLPPVLDVETEGNSDDELRKNMLIWLNEIEKETGMRPIIYTSLSFYETKFKNFLSGYKYWIAAYSRRPDLENDPNIIHWQYSENGVLPGIEEEVDFNVSKIEY